MKSFNILLLILLLASCDAPRTRRFTSSTASNSNSAFNFNNNGSNSGQGTGTTNNGTGDNGTNTVTVPEDAKHCTFSTDGINNFPSTSSHLGAYSLCKSSTDASSVYFQLKTKATGSNGTEVQVCLIPTTNSGNNSIYVGNPMCGLFSDPKQARKITFVKFSQYQNATISGVMIFKDTTYYYPVFNNYVNTLSAYQTCMNALYYGNSAYCEAFKSVGQYVFQGI